MELIKVFITEDESIVREGLRDSIPWGRYGFEFVGDAPDGEMALPMIRKLKPDVLITDIKMPFMDGLSLSAIVSRELPDTKIIILSGYSDFEYARKAIEINVYQYLLKPITKASMIKVLEQIRAKIAEEQEQKDYLSRYEKELEKYESFSRQSFFEALVEGKLSLQDIYDRTEKLGITLDGESYNFVIFTIRDGIEGAYSEPVETVFDRILNFFVRFPEFMLFHCNLHSYAVLIKGSADDIDSLTKRCVKAIEDYCDNAEVKLDWSIAIGTPTKRLSGLPQCYSDVNHVLAYRYMQPYKHIFTAEILKAEKEQLLDKNIQNLDAAKIDPMVIRNFVETGLPEETEMFVKGYLENLGGAENSLMLRSYLMMSAKVNAELALSKFALDKDEISQNIPQPDFTLPEENLEAYLVRVLRSAVALRNKSSLQHNNDMVEQAIKYIDQNYTDEKISLNTVAKAANISSNYLSALFSQRMGMSFVEYLTRKRMEKAKQLLLQTSMRSGEIANEVGYRDPRYFSFVFRKTQGCTPSAFRSGEVDE